MRKLTLKEMQAVCRGSAPVAGGCDLYGNGCPPPKPRPKPKPRPCSGAYC